MLRALPVLGEEAQQQHVVTLLAPIRVLEGDLHVLPAAAFDLESCQKSSLDGGLVLGRDVGLNPVEAGLAEQPVEQPDGDLGNDLLTTVLRSDDGPAQRAPLVLGDDVDDRDDRLGLAVDLVDGGERHTLAGLTLRQSCLDEGDHDVTSGHAVTRTHALGGVRVEVAPRGQLLALRLDQNRNQVVRVLHRHRNESESGGLDDQLTAPELLEERQIHCFTPCRLVVHSGWKGPLDAYMRLISIIQINCCIILYFNYFIYNAC